MTDAVGGYAEYAASHDAEMLGRFIVPAGRLADFSEVAAPHLPRGKSAKPWPIAAVLGDRLGTEFLGIPKFNYEHRAEAGSGRAVIDSIEIRAKSAAQVGQITSAIQKAFKVFVEVPANKLDPAVMDAIAAAGFSAKIRMGGTEPRAFPAARSVVAFMQACRERGISFKATAGLHHIVCGSYPLTYEPHSPKSPMFGFLNVFLGAAFLYAGAEMAEVERILGERDPGAFVFDDSEIQWRGAALSLEQIRTARRKFALSFGSCSFTEPVQELKTLIAQKLGTPT